MNTATVVFTLSVVLYLMIGRSTYRKFIIATRNRDALNGDLNSMLSIIHEQERSLVHFLGYGGWLLFYPAFITLGWIIARLDLEF